MKKISLTLVAAVFSLLPLAHADSGFIVGAGGGVAFGYGDLSGDGGFADGELGYQFHEEGDVGTTLALAFNYTEVDYGSYYYRGTEDLLTLAPRLRLTFPIDDVISIYTQAQAGVNFGDVISDFSWGAGAGFDFRFTKLFQARLGYQVVGDLDGSGYHGPFAGIRFTF